MGKKEVEELFMTLQFNEVLDILLENKVINKRIYDYYTKLYYDAKNENDIDNYKEDFIEGVIDYLY